jgi:hypothetical protein
VHPEGRVSGEADGRLLEENQAVRFITEVAKRCRDSGVPFFWIHPENSLAWRLPEILALMGGGLFQLVDGAPLAFRDGEESKYRVLTSARWFRSEVARPSKRWLLGPGEGWRVFASALQRQLSLQSWAPKPEASSRPARGKKRGPALGPRWGDPSIWEIWFKGKWTRHEHSNVLEGRTSLMAVRNLCRRPARWGQRFLVISDNQASVGAFARGRSSSGSFCSLCRRLSAMKFATGCPFAFRYVETFRNPADGPSRGQGWPGILGAPNPRRS